MSGRKTIAVVAVALMATLSVGVYAGLQLSSLLVANWYVRESGLNLELWWQDNEPEGDLNRGEWYQTRIGLKNNGVATYNVILIFQIRADVSLTTDDLKIQYLDGSEWKPLSLHTVTIGDIDRLEGSYGPPGGFEVGPDYVALTWFRYCFDGSAPLDVEYTFEAWAEQV